MTANHFARILPIPFRSSPKFEGSCVSSLAKEIPPHIILRLVYDESAREDETKIKIVPMPMKGKER
ncbi:hypothetical protein CULT_2050002 [[Clostridium] ultunense Esp]|nr:hypothetical protein CULT_2050002 [[Clostridium] ultunense Esp]